MQKTFSFEKIKSNLINRIALKKHKEKWKKQKKEKWKKVRNRKQSFNVRKIRDEERTKRRKRKKKRKEDGKIKWTEERKENCFLREKRGKTEREKERECNNQRKHKERDKVQKREKT